MAGNCDNFIHQMYFYTTFFKKTCICANRQVTRIWINQGQSVSSSVQFKVCVNLRGSGSIAFVTPLSRLGSQNPYLINLCLCILRMKSKLISKGRRHRRNLPINLWQESIKNLKLKILKIYSSSKGFMRINYRMTYLMIQDRTLVISIN